MNASQQGAPVLALDALRVRAGGRALLDGVSLQVPPRGLLGIVGPNGAGKSSLLRAALGLLPLQAGQVWLDGRPLVLVSLGTVSAGSGTRFLSAAAEALGEKFHASPKVLAALNPGVPLDVAGGTLRVPNVLDIAPMPTAAKIEVDKSDAALRLLDASGKAYAQFPITSGTAKFPLPIGDWTIEAMTPDPWYNYDPALIVTARKGDRKAKLPPGPNGPVGTMWMALSKPHYGIHGTPEPHLIGRTQSSGCVRLTNWSATAVAAASTVGMTVSMVE